MTRFTISLMGLILLHLQQIVVSRHPAKRNQWNISQPEADFFVDFRNYAEFDQFKNHLLIKHPDLWISEISSITTHNGAPLEFITISGSKSTMGPFLKEDLSHLPGIYIQALVHAREWEGTFSILYTLSP